MIGHCDRAAQRFGAFDYTPARIAEILVKKYALRAAKVISIIGCQAAADRGAADHARLSTSIDSFASHLHFELGNKYKVKTIIYARIFNVAVVEDGTKRVQVSPDDEDGQHKLAGSKAKFYWDEDKNLRQVL